MEPIFFKLCFAILFVGASVTVQADELVVETSLGRIKGRNFSSFSRRQFLAFRGIPYAKAPIGALRFHDPVPVEPWEETLDATREGPSCIQVDMVNRGVKGKEDCLILNVYTHELVPADGLRPVMVWIHGGGFFMGSGNGETDYYGPNYLMDKDIVLVTINYRLGPLGFYSTSTESAPGNYGLLDQTLALKWVQQHIRQFGGDPDSVTIFGHSTGAASVHFHVLSPLSTGLFHRAILQSGTGLCSWATPEKVVKHSLMLTEKVACHNEVPDAQLECMRSKAAEDLIMMQETVSISALVFGPRVDLEREHPFLPGQPKDLIKKGQYNHVPIMTGVAENEGLAFLGAAGLLTSKERFSQFKENSVKLLMAFLDMEDQPEGAEMCQQALSNYVNEDLPIEEQIKGLEKLISDYKFLKCADETVHLHARHGSEPIYNYMFSHHGAFSLTKLYRALPEVNYGASHGDELFLIFNNNFLPSLITPEDVLVSKTLIELWTSFAGKGETNSEFVKEWWPVKADGSSYLKIGVLPQLISEKMPFHNRLAFWDKFLHPRAKDEL